MKKITITGSEGLIGTELCKFFSKKYNVQKLDIKLGHDLTNEDFVKKWFKKNSSDSVINCFALNDRLEDKRKRNTLFNFPLEFFSKYLEINLTSLFSVCREYARNNKKGNIVNFSSIYGLVSSRPELYEKSHKDIAYGISKAGVINMTKYLATHLAPNIRVNCVVPGGVKSNQNKQFIKNYSKLSPLQRMMEKNELNEIVSYLASSQSSYVTGSVFVIDGGWTIW